MVVTKGTKEQEYASTVFLKWFTQKENNMRFACTSGYLPVQKDACTKEALDAFVADSGVDISQKTYDGLITGFDIINNGHMYTNKAFNNGTSARKVRGWMPTAHCFRRSANGIKRTEKMAYCCAYCTDTPVNAGAAPIHIIDHRIIHRGKRGADERIQLSSAL